MSSCPVDHSNSTSQPSCPINHQPSSIWSRFSQNQLSGATPLSTERQVSSIPRSSEGNWIYPSEAQFFTAMTRKNHNPQASDMRTVVPIHNAVNERAWAEIMKWEGGRGGEACGDIKLVNFQGRPNERSPRARWNMLLGYSAPFDRHDWIIERCGVRTRYIIDFYTGNNQRENVGNLSFYLDVRPALDNWEGVKMRMEHFITRWSR